MGVSAISVGDLESDGEDSWSNDKNSQKLHHPAIMAATPEDDKPAREAQEQVAQLLEIYKEWIESLNASRVSLFNGDPLPNTPSWSHYRRHF